MLYILNTEENMPFGLENGVKFTFKYECLSTVRRIQFQKLKP